jgi:hypothetical protein
MKRTARRDIAAHFGAPALCRGGNGTDDHLSLAASGTPKVECLAPVFPAVAARSLLLENRGDQARMEMPAWQELALAQPINSGNMVRLSHHFRK